jgi:hypothetical protein
MSSVKLTPWPIDTFDFILSVPFVSNFSNFMSIFEVWAIFSDFEVAQFVVRVNCFECPGNTCLIVPNKVFSVTRWISDPNKMPVIFIVIVDVPILLEDHFCNLWC